MQWYACRERPGSVCNYEKETISNDDDGFKMAQESLKGSLAPLRVPAYSKSNVTGYYITVTVSI